MLAHLLPAPVGCGRSSSGDATPRPNWNTPDCRLVEMPCGGRRGAETLKYPFRLIDQPECIGCNEIHSNQKTTTHWKHGNGIAPVPHFSAAVKKKTHTDCSEWFVMITRGGINIPL